MGGVLDGRNVLVTGGTGSFANKFIEIALREHRPERLIVFSRDELKQSQMRAKWPDSTGSVMRYFIGDVRDVSRLRRALRGVDLVVHAAALKQVPACEYNPMEAVLTNIMGAANVIDAALDQGVKTVLALSTDKSTAATTLYGATKLVAEKLFVQANSYRGQGGTRFSCVRYGNVLGSRGSVVPLFREQARQGRVTITDPRMTRFWITLDQAVRFVLSSVEMMHGGEVYIPKLPSMRLEDMAQTIAPGCAVEYVGVRGNEKIHESMVSVDESRLTVDLGDRYAILPSQPFWANGLYQDAPRVPDGWSYTSDQNDRWLTPHDLLDLLGEATAKQAAAA